MVRAAHDHAALKGVRVLELTNQAGQYAGKLLADMGADVIKIEPPHGSDVRRVGPFKDDVPHRDRSLTFWHYNTSKRGITLNLETEDGRALFRELAASADVVIEGFRPGYLASLGLGYDTLRTANPKLVMCSITPFGQTGPWRDYESSDLIQMALGGIMASSGYNTVDGAPPIAPTGGNTYHMASHIAASAIMVGLIHAGRTGQGQHIDQSIHTVAAQTTELAFHFYVYHDQVVQRQDGRHAMPAIMPKITFVTADGKYMNCLGVNDPKRAQLLIEWMAKTGDAKGFTAEQVATPELLTAAQPQIHEAVTAFIAKHPLDYIFHGAQGIKLAWTPIRSVEDLVDDEHLRDRGMITEVEHPELGESFKYISGPYHFTASHWEIRGRAPLLGEHNEEVFVGELGREKGQLVALAEAGAI